MRRRGRALTSLAQGRLDHGPPIAVIDIGSNSVRLVIYEGLTRAPTPIFNEKVLAGLFSEDAIKNKRNTEAVEVATNTLLAARVAEHVAAATRPFDTVKGDIEKYLKAEEAMKQARSAGEARLAELQKGEDKVAWSAARGVSRLQARQ